MSTSWGIVEYVVKHRLAALVVVWDQMWAYKGTPKYNRSRFQIRMYGEHLEVAAQKLGKQDFLTGLSEAEWDLPPLINTVQDL